MAFIRIARRILGTLICVLLLFAALEIAARAYSRWSEKAHPRKHSPAPTTVVMRRYPDYGIFFHAPRQDFVDTRIPALRHHVVINSFGFRGGEFTKKKPRGVTRVMLLGDSYTYGDGLNQEDTISSRMEGMLNAGTGGKRFEVINAGRMGASIDSEIELFDNYGALFEPDIVVLGYVWNDIPELLGVKYIHERAGAGKEPGGAAAAFSEAMREFTFYNMILMKKAERQAKKGGEPALLMIEKFSKGARPEIEAALREYETRLVSFSRELTKRNTRLVFVVFPTWLRDAEIKRPVNEELSAAAGKNGIPALDLRGAWTSRRGDVMQFFNIDQHPTPEAAEFTAAEIVKKLRYEKILR